jgi:hypothetical protein
MIQKWGGLAVPGWAELGPGEIAVRAAGANVRKAEERKGANGDARVKIMRVEHKLHNRIRRSWGVNRGKQRSCGDICRQMFFLSDACMEARLASKNHLRFYPLTATA